MWLFTERTYNGKVYKQMKKEVGYRDECIKEVPLWNFRIHEVFIKMISSPRDIPINWMAKYRLDQDFVSSKTVVIKKKIMRWDMTTKQIVLCGTIQLIVSTTKITECHGEYLGFSSWLSW